MPLHSIDRLLFAGIAALTAFPVQAMAGVPPLSVSWIHGQADCRSDSSPAFQVLQLNADSFILRQNKCLQYEAPFIYLLFGRERVLMLDTGSIEVASPVSEQDAKLYPLRRSVDEIIRTYTAAHRLNDLPLLVVHTHGHGDHIAGDGLFYRRLNTQVVAPGERSVKAFWRFSSMQGPAVAYDLGGRVLDVMPIPGHRADHIAIYDRNYGLLLAGDSLYPGRLYIADWTAYRASIDRLQAFIAPRRLDYVLGAHIEMSDQPGVDYEVGATYQPSEHVLELGRAHLDELNRALQAIGPSPEVERHADFIIDP